MRIYSFVSKSHEPLVSGWMSSTSRDPELEPHIVNIPIESDGDYMNDQWKEIGGFWSFLTLFSMFHNQGEIIGVTGVDVRFIRPVTQQVNLLMIDCDLLMQREFDGDLLFNPDVLFARCTPEVMRGWMRYLIILHEWDGTMLHQNALMKRAFNGLRIGLLPTNYATPVNGGAERSDIVLFHANNSHPPGSLQKKLEMLRKYES